MLFIIIKNGMIEPIFLGPKVLNCTLHVLLPCKSGERYYWPDKRLLILINLLIEFHFNFPCLFEIAIS